MKQEEIIFEARAGVAEDWRQQSIWIDRVLDEWGKPAAVNDRESHILWLGDSFTGWYRKESGDILRLIYARLGHRFDQISGDGYGSDSLWSMLGRRQNALEGKRLVIWMFTATTLSSRRLKKIDLFAGDEPR